MLIGVSMCEMFSNVPLAELWQECNGDLPKIPPRGFGSHRKCSESPRPYSVVSLHFFSIFFEIWMHLRLIFAEAVSVT
jgi:hypothetical protein